MNHPTLTFHKANGAEVVLPRPLDAPDCVLFDARWFDNEVGRALGLRVASSVQVVAQWVGTEPTP